MAHWEKTLQQAMSGQADASIAFRDLCALLPHVGYIEDRQKGSHHIFIHPDRPGEAVNVQPGKSGKAKSYQVKQAPNCCTSMDTNAGDERHEKDDGHV